MSHGSNIGQRMVLEYRAREAWTQRNYSAVEGLANQWAAASLEDSENESWWNATHLQAEALRKQGRMNESKDLADTLEQHPLTSSSTALKARVLTLRAFALQGLGDLTAAVDAAERATAEARSTPDHNGIAIEAQNALIAALAESGRINEAWQACLRLVDLLEAEPEGQTTGMGYWAIGNVAFLLKRRADGVEYHERAAKHLSPVNNLDLWARFNRASADLRLTAGELGPETLECIERAEMASSIVGGSERDRVELRLIRAHWLVLTGQFDMAIPSLEDIVHHKDLLALHTAAHAHFLLGQALMSTHRDVEATAQLTVSELLFAESGAEDRASTARTLIRSIERV